MLKGSTGHPVVLPWEHLDISVFEDGPVFCFTSDLEWSPEWAVQELLQVFANYGTPLTPFVTHSSAAIQERYSSTQMSVLMRMRSADAS